MWDATLIESKGPGKRGKTWLTFPVALLIHALVVGVLIVTSYWSVEAVQGPVLNAVHWIPVQLPKGGSGSVIPKATPKPPAKPTASHLPLVQPETIPETLTQETPEAPVENNQDVSSNNIEGEPGGGSEVIPGGYPGVDGIGTGVLSGSGSDEPIVITPNVKQPVLIRKITPNYPPICIRAHIQGIVLLEAVITRTGSVEELRVLHSAHPLLEQAAVNAVKQWLYRPALVNGNPVKVYFNVTVDFKIQ